jgi:hypothetical protein
MGVISGAGNFTLPEHLGSSPVFSQVIVAQLFFCVVFSRSCLYFCLFSLTFVL